MIADNISIIVPVYNSEKSLDELVHRISSHIDGLVDRYEILLIDDGSSDQSWSRIVFLKNVYSNLKGYKLARNYGQHNALLAGIRKANGNIIVTLDDDLQNPPEEIFKLIKHLNQNCDVVYGRSKAIQQGFFRRNLSIFIKTILKKILRASSAEMISSFRAFKSSLVVGFVDYKNPSVNIDVLLSWSTSKFGYTFVDHDARRYGASNYSFMQLINHAFTMLVGFSSLPLKFAGFMGGLVALFGLAVLIYVLSHYFIYGTSVPGFVFTISLMSIFSGAQLIGLGIIGEYLARSHDWTIEKPQYVIEAVDS